MTLSTCSSSDRWLSWFQVYQDSVVILEYCIVEGTFHLVMLHCVIIAQLMLDFTIRKQKRNLDINDNTHVHHVKPETSDWVISNGAHREQIPLCHCGPVRMVWFWKNLDSLEKFWRNLWEKNTVLNEKRSGSSRVQSHANQACVVIPVDAIIKKIAFVGWFGCLRCHAWSDGFMESWPLLRFTVLPPSCESV